MKTKFILLFLFWFCAAVAQEEKKQKCTLYFDKEFGRSFYYDMDIYPEFIDKKTDVLDFIPTNFKVPTKKYKKNEQVQFAWLVEKNGTSTFLKLIYPPDDKELEEEAKRIVSMLPLYRPAMCGKDTFPCKIDINFSLTKKRK
ncbi:MAG: hypothetical protein AB7G44_00170 [Bacteroidia bacterium]